MPGHSIVVGSQELALRIVPSAVMHPGVELFIGGGTVVNPQTLLDELERLAAIGIDTSRVKISDRAHVVLPHHVTRDAAAERERGSGAIGTTGRGIGPAYVDRVARSGVRFADIDNVTQGDTESPNSSAPARSAALSLSKGQGDIAEGEKDVLEAARRLAPHVVDGVEYIHERLNGGKRILLEGAQGTLLDVGYGTYPYVTSSHTIAGGACTGTRHRPRHHRPRDRRLQGLLTRVGAGPLPSELHDECGERLRRQGGEFGTVTGRPRRCGWFDAVAARYAVALNGLTNAIVTKLDVLTGFERVGVVTDYRAGGGSAGFSAAGEPDLQIDVEELPGWSEPIVDCRRIADLPAAARAYLRRLQEVLNVPIEMVSVGRERSQLAR